ESGGAAAVVASGWTRSASAEPAAVEAQLASTLANYEESRKWRVDAAGESALAKSSQPAGETQRLRIELGQDGVYVITGREVAGAGVSLSAISPGALALTHRGKSVAILVEGGSDGSFDEEDRIIFIGRHNSARTFQFSQYSDNAVYWLSWDGSVGARFAESPASPPQNAADTLTSGQFQLHLE